MAHRKLLRGFTLLEILVVLAVFGIVMVVITQILFASLKGSLKSDVTIKTKREAERTMAVMERLLHNARRITSCEGNRVDYVDQYGGSASFSCVSPGTENSRIASGSGTLTVSDIKVHSCFISCEPTGGEIRSVLIDVVFTQKAGARPEEMARLNLKSRVTLRN